MLIRELPESERERWDAYVHSAEGGLPQHQYGWRNVMQDTYGYDTHYFAAEQEASSSDANEIVGVMPLYVIKSSLVGRSVNTMPGGFCAHSDEVASALIRKGAELAKEINAKRFVVHDSRIEWPSELGTECRHEAWIVDVRGGEDEVWSGLHRNIRRQVRMGRKNELTVEIDRKGELLGDFYTVFSQFAHQAGTPVFGLSFLENVIRQFQDGFDIVVVYLEGKPIAGYFQLEMGNSVYGAWGAALHEFFKLRPVYLAYWSILAEGIERGFDYLDMGRAPLESSASKFKGQWNGESVPVYQQTLSIDGSQKASSAATQAQEDSKFQMVRQYWPKLPYSVAVRLGPKLRRHIPFA